MKSWPVRGEVKDSHEEVLANGSKDRVYPVWIAKSWVHVGADQLCLVGDTTDATSAAPTRSAWWVMTIP